MTGGGWRRGWRGHRTISAEPSAAPRNQAIEGRMRRMAAGMTAGALALAATAEAYQPTDGGTWLLPPASKLAEEVHFFHDWVLFPVITGISLFVLALLIWIVVRFNSRANPTPQKFSHNTMLEVVWTGIPIFILLYIALFSFDLLYNEDVIPDGKQVVAAGDGSTNAFTLSNDFPASRRATRPEHVQVFLATAQGRTPLRRGADYSVEGLGDAEIKVTVKQAPARGEAIEINAGRSLIGSAGFFGNGSREIALAPSVTLKVVGNQWNWLYAYPDYGDFQFVSNMLPADQAPPALYRFEVDNRVVVPVGETIRVTTTGADVIHSWAMPNFAIKIDAVPGRINETWFKAEREGVYYGQCSEICGVKHAFMPIAVEVVSRAAFCNWIATRQAENQIARTAEEKRREPVCGAFAAPNRVAAVDQTQNLN
jgi:cytochrome c oxidase subunit 2